MPEIDGERAKSEEKTAWGSSQSQLPRRFHIRGSAG